MYPSLPSKDEGRIVCKNDTINNNNNKFTNKIGYIAGGDLDFNKRPRPRPAPKLEKSIWVAYLLWCVGGWFSLHLLYLRRDKQAFIYWTTMGGYLGVGVMRDMVRLPAYTHEVNQDQEYLQELTTSMRKNKKPPFSLTRYVAQLMVGNLWYLIVEAAVPREDLFWGINVRPLTPLIAPMAAAIGVWVIGNIGRERGPLLWPVIGSYIVLVPGFLLSVDASNWCALVAASAFNKYSRQWRRTPSPRRSVCRRGMALGGAWLMFCGLVASFLYYNATLHDAQRGEKVKFRDAAGHFIRSPMFQQFKENLRKVYLDVFASGPRLAWANFVELLDPTGRIHALKVLELSRNATQAEIKDRVRELSRKWHPDKHHSPEDKAAAQDKFLIIQQAGDNLLDAKRRRNRNSNRSNNDNDDNNSNSNSNNNNDNNNNDNDNNNNQPPPGG